MHYGSGVFEGIRAYATRDGAAVFRLPEHLERMRKGCELLGMDFDIAHAIRFGDVLDLDHDVNDRRGAARTATTRL